MAAILYLDLTHASRLTELMLLMKLITSNINGRFRVPEPQVHG